MSLTTIVIPTIGRPSLRVLLEALTNQTEPVTAPVVLVGDPHACGPAAARNLGWRRARTPWVSFLDDDVVPGPEWYADLLTDLAAADASGRVASQGMIVVPRPEGRQPTDDERATLGLAGAPWITADMSVRRDALAAIGGFDERFRRAYREDTDLALRLGAEHGAIAQGWRRTRHPVRDDGFWASVRRQRGNEDDQLMRRLHGRRWRRRGRTSLGWLPRHFAITALGLGALVKRRLALGWLAGTVAFALSRLRNGPWTRDEVLRMTVTSVLIPPLACAYAIRGRLRHRSAQPWRGLPDVVLFDRDGTLVHDVPYNGDPDAVRPVAQAGEVLARLRAAGIRVALVTNQSGIGRGLIDPADVDAVNERLAELIGPWDGCYVCPHTPDDGCDCRKPGPELVRRACADLGADPARVVMVGDIGADVDAARAAGAHGILVPTAATRLDEVAAAPVVVPDLRAAADRILGGAW